METKKGKIVTDCIATVCSDNDFQYFIPTFVFTAKRAYPDVVVRVFIKGKLKKNLKKIIKYMKKENGMTGIKIHENEFSEYPDTPYMCNLLRLLIPKKYLIKHRYVLIEDVDFLIFKQNPSHFNYYHKKMEVAKQPVAAFRSAILRPRRPEICPNGWRGNYKRVVAGTFMIDVVPWLHKTDAALKYYSHIAATGTHDNRDRHRPGSYREYDEVMFQRILKMSGLRTPGRKWYFPCKQRFNIKYRDLHLGDFKNDRFRKSGRMRHLLSRTNMHNFKKLDKEPQWEKVVDAVTVNDNMRKIIQRVRKFV